MNILNFILENKDYLEDLITRSTYHSNAIEGSTLTYAETYAILYNDNSFLYIITIMMNKIFLQKLQDIT